LYQQRTINGHSILGILDLAEFAKSSKIEGKRNIEKAGTRYVLQQLLNLSEDLLEYNENRKPYLRGSQSFISISHSHDRLAVMISTKGETGVDIELVRDKVLNIQHKFLSHDEEKFAKNNVDKLLTIWAAKEAMFKIYGIGEVDFSRHLNVEFLENSLLVGRICIKEIDKKFLMKAENLDNYKLVYLLDEL
jgi:4'-phosphopantetheinyl transferase